MKNVTSTDPRKPAIVAAFKTPAQKRLRSRRLSEARAIAREVRSEITRAGMVGYALELGVEAAVARVAKTRRISERTVWRMMRKAKGGA